jgi:hypothetical protein
MHIESAWRRDGHVCSYYYFSKILVVSELVDYNSAVAISLQQLTVLVLCLVYALHMYMQVLASGGQPLLVQELSMLVRDVAVVDEVSYCKQAQSFDKQTNTANSCSSNVQYSACEVHVLFESVTIKRIKCYHKITSVCVKLRASCCSL